MYIHTTKHKSGLGGQLKVGPGRISFNSLGLMTKPNELHKI